MTPAATAGAAPWKTGMLKNSGCPSVTADPGQPRDEGSWTEWVAIENYGKTKFAHDGPGGAQSTMRCCSRTLSRSVNDTLFNAPLQVRHFSHGIVPHYSAGRGRKLDFFCMFTTDQSCGQRLQRRIGLTAGTLEFAEYLRKLPRPWPSLRFHASREEWARVHFIFQHFSGYASFGNKPGPAIAPTRGAAWALS